MRRCMLCTMSLAIAACAHDAPTSTATKTPTGGTPSGVRTTTVPVGWIGYSGAPVAFVIGTDPNTVHSGGHAGYISSVGNPAANNYAMLYHDIPADAYRGRRVRLSGWLRPTGMAAPGGGLWMRVDGSTSTLTFDNMMNRAVTGTGDWRQASVVLDVPASAIGIAFGILDGGAGDLLFDDLSLDVVSTDVPSTNLLTGPQAPSHDSLSTVQLYARSSPTPVNLDFELLTLSWPASTSNWLSQNAVPLTTVLPGSGFDDLAPLRQMIGSAHLFGMGEDTHGTSEFFHMKHRVFEYLVNQMGFTRFAIEATSPEADNVNTFVLTGQGNASQLLSNLHFWTWNTQEVLDLILWMRQWNSTAPIDKRVQFAGFDMQFPGAAMDTVVNFIGRVDPAQLGSVTSSLSCLANFRNHGGVPGQSDTVYMSQPAASRDDCRNGLQAIYDLIIADSTPYRTASSPALYANALHSARLVQQYEGYLTRMFSGLARDQYMAENIEWLRSQAGPDARMMLWAHNLHISAGPGWMGSLLRAAYGDDYVNLGFLFGGGQFNAVGCGPGGSLSACVTNLVPGGSLEDLFAAAGQSLSLFDTRRIAAAGAVAAPLAVPISMREIGAVFQMGSDASYFQNQLFPADFQLLIYVKTTTASKLLP